MSVQEGRTGPLIDVAPDDAVVEALAPMKIRFGVCR
jgi:hypothetical protein